MALAMTVTDHWDDGKRLHVTGTLTASGSYSTGGDTLPTNPAIKTTKNPVFVVVNMFSAYYAQQNGAKVKFFTAAGAEVSAGAYPSDITEDTITFYAIYHKFR